MKAFEQLRIVFFGTPDFAVAFLHALVSAGAAIVAVVTAPDKPAGRGKLPHAPAVKEYAVAHNLPLLQPEKMKNPDFLQELKALNVDLQVVVAFRMMPVAVWDMPPMGTLNVHGSLLPQYRGAAPINRAIMNGETETGVTTFKLKHEIDTGDIMLQEKVAILPEDNAGTLHDKLMEAGAALLVRTIKLLAEDNITEVPQDNTATAVLKNAPKIFKEDTYIDWNNNGETIHNFVRGLAPYPAAHTRHNEKGLKVFAGHYIKEEHDATPGAMQTDHAAWLRFATGDGWYYVHELQLEGKKRMDVVSFLRGFRG
ncbi:MAG: methionyl-tRNA formyltransferase [Taibaiella sp.]|nr:methionyl-tRNA formyltransferase [Taibaiella sp.]